MYAMPLSAAVAVKNAFSASMPPAEAPIPTIGKRQRARGVKSTESGASPGVPDGLGVAAGQFDQCVGNQSAGDVLTIDVFTNAITQRTVDVVFVAPDARG